VRKARFPDSPEFQHPEFDYEHRIVTARLPDLTVASIYVPNGGKDFPAKMRFLESLAAFAADYEAAGRRLVLCVRDTPFSRIHLENMLRAQQAGALIMPAIPSFYHQPQTIDDLVTQYVCRVLVQLGLPQNRQFAWKGQPLRKALKI